MESRHGTLYIIIVKELQLSYYKEETLQVTIYPELR